MGARLLLAGYFGSGNLGDDAILLGFINGISESNYQVRVLAGSAERMMRSYGLTGVPKMDMGSVKNAISECDALVFPGGSIFQDVTSVRSVAYYANLVKQAKASGKKVVMLGQGVGPLNRFLGKKLAAGAFNSADLITVRDPGSGKKLAELGVKHRPQVTADNAFLLKTPEVSEDSGSFGVAGMRTIGISARPWGKDRNKTVVKVFSDLVRLIYSQNMVPYMIEMDEVEDRALIHEISKQNGGKVPEIKGITTPAQLQMRLARMEAVIAMRLHAGILATTVGVPPYMVSYDPKVAAFANGLGFSAPLQMEGITAERIFDGFQTFLKDRDRVAESIERKREDMAKAAFGNVEALRNCLGS